MKNSIALLLIFIGSLCTFAQEQENASNNKNEIGLVATDLIDGSFVLRYERLLGKHITANLGLGYKGEDGLINLSGINREKIKTGNITYSGIKVIPEVRYYLNNISETGMNGFYFGAYLKHSNFKSNLNGTYINDADESFIIEFDAKIKVTSIGLMIGYKLPVSKRFSIDFLIAGPGSGSYNFTLTNKRDLPEEFYEDLNTALEQYSLFDYLDGDFRFSDVKDNSKFTVPSFRYGIAMTYSF
jgi:hypothetical protein